MHMPFSSGVTSGLSSMTVRQTAISQPRKPHSNLRFPPLLSLSDRGTKFWSAPLGVTLATGRRSALRTMPEKPKSAERTPQLSGEAFEVAPTVPIQVRQTNRLYRLTPVNEDLAQPNRQIALIATDTEAHARALAAAHDPFDRNWNSEREFVCDFIESSEVHVVGDVLFKSAPRPRYQN